MADPTHLNVLLVTSDSDTRRRLRAHSHNLDQTCVVALRCSDAKALSAQTAFDAIVCDLTLPDGDALQLIESLGNNQPPWAILVSPYIDQDLAQTAHRAGFDSCLDLSVASQDDVASALAIAPYQNKHAVAA